MVQVTKYAGQVYYLSAGAQGMELQLPAALNIDGIVLPISVLLTVQISQLICIQVAMPTLPTPHRRRADRDALP